MSRLFGWDLPPGCSMRDIEDAAGGNRPCEVCGQYVDDCICPECPTCHCNGDPLCYDMHDLTRTPEQIAGRAELDAKERKLAAEEAAEAEYWADPQRKIEDADLEDYWRDLEGHTRGNS